MARHRYVVHPQISCVEHAQIKLRRELLIILTSFLLFSLGACSAGTSSAAGSPATSSPTVGHPTPTPTSLPSGIVLYQADWSHGLSGLQVTSGWKVVQGMLVANSSNPATITIPYRPVVANYAIEVRLQIVRLLQTNGGYFSIFAMRATDKDGFQAGVSDLKGTEPRPNGSHPQAQVFINPMSSMLQGSGLPIDYEPGFQWHTFRVEVLGNEARLLVDGVQIGHASSEQTDTLSNGPIGLTTALVVLRVSSLRILTL
jgi:hypothetical protein